MKFAFLLSTFGGSPLECGLSRGLVSMGHEVVSFHNGRDRDYDVLVVFNQCAHRLDYAYPEFPAYDVPVAFVDAAEYGYFKRLPGVVANYANAFAPGSMAHDTKSAHEQTRLKSYLEGRSFPYFLREFSKHLDYPDNYHPIDYPLYHLSHCSDRPDKGDYLRRTRPLWVCWGASHPWRMQLTDAMQNSGVTITTRDGIFGVETFILGVTYDGRMDQGSYFNNMVRSRCGPSFDGYGTGSFRMTETLVRTLLLMGPLHTRVPYPVVDGETCVEYEVEYDGEKFLGTNVAERLHWVVNHPTEAFRIYEAGYDFCMTKLTEEATARYFLETVEKHDWSLPTDLLTKENS